MLRDILHWPSFCILEFTNKNYEAASGVPPLRRRRAEAPAARASPARAPAKGAHSPAGRVAAQLKPGSPGRRVRVAIPSWPTRASALLLTRKQAPFDSEQKRTRGPARAIWDSSESASFAALTRILSG